MIIKDFVKNWNFPNIDLNNWMLSHSQLNVAGPIIGSGEFGKVECASLQIESVSIQVAVKSVIPGNCRTACYRDFCNEAERLITLQEHNNIIKLYGFVTRGDPKYIVIEYAKHGDLKCYLHTLRNSVITVAIETRLVKIAMNVASALEYMETLRVKYVVKSWTLLFMANEPLRTKCAPSPGEFKRKSKFSFQIVHRDLACRNILLTEDYIAKIGDFGLSRDVYESGEYSLLQGAEGQGPLPLRWMPPELLNRGIFEPKSDVWSFGVVMWEIASLGETPFQTLPVFVFSKMLDDGTRLHKPNNCTNKAYILMYKCWLKHIESRPSPSTLLEELEEFLSENEKIFTNIHPDALSHVVDESQV
uniref:Fibroblast growth factor receptor 3-like n=1 Tax=Saccoglossus kowalevskii TaxID=10224 RepID=A0ABM0M250_SACKO|nr:PREDICTED: fibroblast growth factor receptor 3-like [Saccoglossus kowalevskii]